MSHDHANTTATMTASSAAASLYVGNVMHARLKPMGHRFSLSRDEPA